MLAPLASLSYWVRFVAAFFAPEPPAIFSLGLRADIILAGMPRSFFVRVWDAIKPPPAPPARRRLNRAQRRLIRVTAITTALGASTWGVYAYLVSAPERANNHYRQGVSLIGPGDFKDAAAQFTTAIDIFPEYADAYLERGKARQASGQNDAALADFEKAIAIDPTLEPAYVARGTVWRSRGDRQKALADFTVSIHLRPTADAYYERGLTYQMLSQPQHAVDDYNLAIDRDPAPYIYRARAKAKRDLGDTAGAQSDQEKAERVEKTQ
jgi:tetratricopeptide (TPR) repeat protein